MFNNNVIIPNNLPVAIYDKCKVQLNQTYNLISTIKVKVNYLKIISKNRMVAGTSTMQYRSRDDCRAAEIEGEKVTGPGE